MNKLRQIRWPAHGSQCALQARAAVIEGRLHAGAISLAAGPLGFSRVLCDHATYDCHPPRFHTAWTHSGNFALALRVTVLGQAQRLI